MNEVFTLREAAERLGVHYMTVYRYVRLGQLPAHRDGRTWYVTSGDLAALRRDTAGPGESVARRSVAWHERLTNRLLAADASGAWKVVEAAQASGMSPIEVYVEMFVPTLRLVGERWESGEAGVDEEHQVSVMMTRLIGRMGPSFSTRGRRKGTVVLAAPPGENHGLGLAMAADVIRGGGYSALDLGANTPVVALQAAISRIDDAVGVCLGALTPAALDTIQEMVLAARGGISRTSPVILGGAAVRDAAHARSLGADGVADLTSVVGMIEMGRESHPSVNV